MAFNKNEKQFIKDNYIGIGNNDLAVLLNREFNTSYTKEHVKIFKKNNKLNSGLTGRFEKGHISHNKGKKGVYCEGSKKTWFKKGRIPHNYAPIGTERVKADGYVWVKIEDPNKWKQKHILLWEKQHGKVGAGKVICFLDGDRTNVSLENLYVLTNAEHLYATNKGLRSNDANISKIGFGLSKLVFAIKKKESSNERHNKKNN